MGYAARLKIVQSAGTGINPSDPELVGTFVRLITGKGLGIIESVSGDTAVVFDLGHPGMREILSCAILMRAVT